jgi:hypothetical protein
MLIVVFWVKMPCSLVGGCQRFECSIVKKGVVRSNETFVTTYKTTECHDSEADNRHLNRRQNPKTPFILIFKPDIFSRVRLGIAPTLVIIVEK